MTPHYGITPRVTLSDETQRIMDALKLRGPAAMRAAHERLKRKGGERWQVIVSR